MSPRINIQHSNHNCPKIRYEQCYAKTTPDGSPGLTVYEHCVAVGEIGRVLVNYLPASLKQIIRQDSGIVAALHDVGKVSPGFQLKYFRNNLSLVCPALADYVNSFETNHARISEAAICQRLYVDTCDDPLAKYARIVGFHHGRRQEAPTTDTGEIYGGPSWSRERQRLIQTFESKFGPLSISDLPDWQLDLLAGLVCVADWIGSDESFFPPEGLPAGANICALAKQAVTGCGWRRKPFNKHSA